MKRKFYFLDLVGMCKNHPDIVEGLLKQYRQRPDYIDQLHMSSPAVTLDRAFTWSLSDEGEAFWDDIHIKLYHAFNEGKRYL